MSRSVGRPSLSSDDRRTKRINVPISDTTHVALVQDSGKNGVTKAAWLRRRLLEEVAKLEVVSEPSEGVASALLGQASLLNQLTFKVHQEALGRGQKGVAVVHRPALKKVLLDLIRLADDISDGCQVTIYG